MAYTEYHNVELDKIPVNKREVLRYMGAKDASDELMRIIDECIVESSDALGAKLCFDEYEISISGDTVDLGFCRVESGDLSKNLKGAEKAVVFCATVGFGMDRLIARYSRLSPVKALCLGAIGNERVEALCDLFCEELKERYKNVSPRFSPGYGDLSLQHQKDIFKALDCTKNLGIALSDRLLMTPSKSVTAIVGIESGE